MPSVQGKNVLISNSILIAQVGAAPSDKSPGEISREANPAHGYVERVYARARKNASLSTVVYPRTTSNTILRFDHPHGFLLSPLAALS